MSKIILFSGGVESTALMTAADPGDVILTIRPAFKEDAPTFLASNAEKIAQHFGHKISYASMSIPADDSPYFSVHQMHSFISVCNLVVARDRRIQEVWCGRNSKEPSPSIAPMIDRLMQAWALLQPGVGFFHPLDHLSKRDQWDMIPDEVKPLVSSCIHHRMCGMCYKCLELTCLSETSPSIM